jgi:hypothetical protein
VAGCLLPPPVICICAHSIYGIDEHIRIRNLGSVMINIRRIVHQGRSMLHAKLCCSVSHMCDLSLRAFLAISELTNDLYTK